MVILEQLRSTKITKATNQSETFPISKALKRRLDSEIFCLASERVNVKGTDLSGIRYVLFFHPEKEEPLSYEEFSFIKNYYALPLLYNKDGIKVYEDGRFFMKHHDHFKNKEICSQDSF